MAVADPFLAGLPAPAVIEELDFEAILAGDKADLISRFPPVEPILALESSPTVKLLETDAYRETILRARINDAARANLLAYASGPDLDHVGAGASPSVARLEGETDEAFRSRILLAVKARNVGSKARYELTARSASVQVADAIAYRVGHGPKVYVAILSTDAGGAASPTLIATVKAAFDLPENRLVNGEVEVLSAVTSIVNVVAALTVRPGTPTTIATAAEAALRAAWAVEGGLGVDLTRDWIKARLLVAGVYAVTLTAPASDAVKPPYEAASLGTVTLTIAGENV